MKFFRCVVALIALLLALPAMGSAAAAPSDPATSVKLADPVLEPATGVTAAAAGLALRFTSLASALAAHAVAAVTEEDEAVRCMASAIYFESKGEPLDGQLAVAEVILNRTRSGRYPADICGVVRQHGQFSFVHGGVIPVIDGARTAYTTALSVARVAMARAWESSAPHAIFFHARRVAPGGRMVRVAAIGNHIFYR